MKEKIEITASIVLYNEDLGELTKTVNSFLNVALTKRLYLIDNTREQLYKNIFHQEEVEYIGVGKNIGFGAGQNRVIDRIKNKSNFHLILNPDVTFDKLVIPNLIKQLKKDEDLAMISPKVLFPTGEHQYSCRRYPHFLELIGRRFNFLNSFFKPAIYKGQYRDKDLTDSFYAEYLAGCFHLYKTEHFIQLNGFDERYFLYMEDVDICRKVDLLGKKKLYYPKEEIRHILKQGSSKSIKLLIRHSFSAIKYFLKWGF